MTDKLPHRLASLDALRPAGETDLSTAREMWAVAMENSEWASRRSCAADIRCGALDDSPAMVAIQKALVSTPTPPPEEVAGLVERLRELLAGAGFTRLVTDYIPPEIANEPGCAIEEGWRIHDFPPAHGDPKRPEIALEVAEGLDEARAHLIMETINALPTLLDAIASLSAQVAGKECVAVGVRSVGVSRMSDNDKAVLVSFRSRPTDDDLRAIHDLLGEQ